MRVLGPLALLFVLVPVLHLMLAKPRVHAEFWPNGSLKSEYTMRRGWNGDLVADGPYRSRHASGQIETDGLYERGHETGGWTWYDSTGNTIARCSFDGGIGRFEGFFPSGKLQTAGTMRGMVRVGRWTEWYENGNKRMQGDFVDGKQHGQWSYWSESDSTNIRRLVWEHGRALNP